MKCNLMAVNDIIEHLSKASMGEKKRERLMDKALQWKARQGQMLAGGEKA